MDATKKTGDGKVDAAATARKGRKAAPKDETKEQRFKRLANKRVPRALRALRMLENLGQGAAYGYSKDQKDKIIEAVGVACQRVFASFNPTVKDETNFFV